MGNKPSHKIVPLGGPDCEPGDIFYCEDCRILFAVEPCTGEGTVRCQDIDGQDGMVPCCPFDGAWGDRERQFWRMNETWDYETVFLAIKGIPSGFTEYEKELVDMFKNPPYDCCGRWIGDGKVVEETKDGWTVYSKSFMKNI